MVSEKVIITLLVLAIILSVVSIVISLSVDTSVPDQGTVTVDSGLNPIPGDNEPAQVGIDIVAGGTS